MEYEDYLFVPKDRLGALIGENGSVKKKIERNAGVKINIDSKTGEINLERDQETDATLALKAENVIKAIARGFSPEKALQLMKNKVYLRIINLEDITQNQKQLQRQKGRIIGTKGKARRHLEALTNTYISVYGKTISIIGSLEDVEIADRAIRLLATGSPHGRVYQKIEKRKARF